MNKKILETKVPRVISVYGTLRKGWQNHRLIADAEYLGTGRTVEELVLTQSGIPYVSRDKVGNPAFPTSHIVVEVYRVNDSFMMQRLDSLEGHPNWYFRSPVQVELENGETVETEIYLNEESTGTSNPTGDFAVKRFA